MSIRTALRQLRYFFFNDPATTEIYTLSLHDALPISLRRRGARRDARASAPHDRGETFRRSEEHTSELQSRLHLVCRLLLEKKKTAVSVRPAVRQDRDRRSSLRALSPSSLRPDQLQLF